MRSFVMFDESHDSVMIAISHLLLVIVALISSSLLAIERVLLRKKVGKS